MKCIQDHYTERRSIKKFHMEIKPCLPTCTNMHIGLSGWLKQYTQIQLLALFQHDFNYRYYKESKDPTDEYVQYNDSDPVSGNTSVLIEVLNQSQKLVLRRSFTNLDLVVTIGSIIGLFFGASFLSLVEIVYIWLLRRYEWLINCELFWNFILSIWLLCSIEICFVNWFCH